MSLDDEVLALLGDVTDSGVLNYTKLWSALDYEFDPLHHGRYSQIAELFTISSMPPCDNSDKLMRFYKFIKKHYIALSKIGAGHEVEGFKIKILSKLCGTALDKVSSLILEADGQPVVSQILNVLKEEISILQLQEIADKVNETYTSAEEVNSKVTEATSELDSGVNTLQQSPVIPILKPSCQLKHQAATCIFCGANNHNSNTCRKFRVPSEYQHVLFRKYSCFNCLNHGHKGFACPYPKQCNLCDDTRKHSPVLCNLYNYYY